VEVKNVGPSGVFRTQGLRVADVEAQRRYADLTGAQLVFAHYWAGINIWTVVDSHVLRREGKYFKLDMSTAMMANEFGLLGDRVVVTSARLVLSLFADQDAPSTPIGEDAQTIPIDVAGKTRPDHPAEKQRLQRLNCRGPRLSA
jgi:hypothetical protein